MLQTKESIFPGSDTVLPTLTFSQDDVAVQRFELNCVCSTY
jgi:hypothetical protein